MANTTKQDQRQSLAAISSLKRVLGIQNHPSRKDEYISNHLHIYTPDDESAILLAELLYRYANGNLRAHYDAHPEHRSVRDTIMLKPLTEGGYEIEMWSPGPAALKTSLERMIKKHIAPEERFRR